MIATRDNEVEKHKFMYYLLSHVIETEEVILTRRLGLDSFICHKSSDNLMQYLVHIAYQLEQ